MGLHDALVAKSTAARTLNWSYKDQQSEDPVLTLGAEQLAHIT